MAIDPKDLGIHDQVLVETEIQGVEAHLPSFVTNVLPEEIWLAAATADVRLLELEPGQAVHLTFDRGGALIAESAFLRRLGDPMRVGMERSRVFAVRRPKGVGTVQRRAHVRVDLQRVVRIRSLGQAGSDEVGVGKTMNIGAGGIQFTTEMPLMLGEQLKTALFLTPKDIIIAAGPVVRIEDAVPDGSGSHLGAVVGHDGGEGSARTTRSMVAVRFDKISELDQERITCHILSARRQRMTAPKEQRPAIPGTTAPEAAAGVPETPSEGAPA